MNLLFRLGAAAKQMASNAVSYASHAFSRNGRAYAPSEPTRPRSVRDLSKAAVEYIGRNFRYADGARTFIESHKDELRDVCGYDVSGTTVTSAKKMYTSWERHARDPKAPERKADIRALRNDAEFRNELRHGAGRKELAARYHTSERTVRRAEREMEPAPHARVYQGLSALKKGAARLAAPGMGLAGAGALLLTGAAPAQSPADNHKPPAYDPRAAMDVIEHPRNAPIMEGDIQYPRDEDTLNYISGNSAADRTC